MLLLLMLRLRLAPLETYTRRPSSPVIVITCKLSGRQRAADAAWDCLRRLTSPKGESDATQRRGLASPHPEIGAPSIV